MALTPKLLGQARNNDTDNNSLYSPGADILARITSLKVCNTSGADATCRIFHDEDGNTGDQSNALYYDITIPAGTTLNAIERDDPIFMRNSSGNLIVQNNPANSLTFSAYGIEEDI